MIYQPAPLKEKPTGGGDIPPPTPANVHHVCYDDCLDPCPLVDKHHYVALLECGHYFELKESWNQVLDNPEYKPNEAYCRLCSEGRHVLTGLKRVLKFAKVDD